MESEEFIKKLQEFIEINCLSFEEGERNTNLTVIGGYALFLDEFCEEDDIYKAIPDKYKSDELYQEAMKVFNYCYYNDYGNWWTKEIASSTWKF